MTWDIIKLNEYIEGTFAERLFELMHTELKCQVYRTGHEVLYPHLIPLEKGVKKLHHNNKEAKLLDKEEIVDMELGFGVQIKGQCDKLYHEVIREMNKREGDDSVAIYTDKVTKKIITYTLANKPGDLRFKKSIVGTRITSNPDFTLLTIAGQILQVEVKYRVDGIVSAKEQSKYLHLVPPPHLFVVMSNEPFIKIYSPQWTLDNHDAEEKYLNDGRQVLYEFLEDRARYLTDKQFKSTFGRDIIEPLNEKDKKWLEDEFKNILIKKVESSIQAGLLQEKDLAIEIALRHPEWWFYEEILPQKDGSIFIETTGLKRDRLVYSSELLGKYKELIKKWLPFNSNNSK